MSWFKNDSWKHYDMRDDAQWSWTLRARRWFWTQIAIVTWYRFPKIRQFACCQLPGAVRLEVYHEARPSQPRD